MAEEAFSVVEFRVSATAQGVVQVVPFVDGVSLLERVGDHEREQGHDLAGKYAGLAPAHFQFGDLSAYYLGLEDDQWPESGRVAFLGCECGEVGCWPLEASVVVTDQAVAWFNFGQPFRPDWDYSGFGPFVFERGQYDPAVVDAIARLGQAST